MSLDINWLAVVVAAVATFMLGGVWYGPLFGRVWRAAEGQAAPPPSKAKHPTFVYGLSFLLMLTAALGRISSRASQPFVRTSNDLCSQPF